MTFEKAIEIVLQFEGGFALDPNDPGGATKYGISSKSYPALNIQDLTIEQASEIYKRDYWDKYKILFMPDFLRLAIFDSCVNHGPHLTIKKVQELLSIPADGVVGPLTINALMAANEHEFLYSFCHARFVIYTTSKNFSHFGAGWMKRLIDVIFKTFEG